jgi:hypothetical protein
MSWQRTDQQIVAEIINAGRVDYRSSLQKEFITSSSSRMILRNGFRQLGADEEPEEVAGSCDVNGKCYK